MMLKVPGLAWYHKGNNHFYKDYILAEYKYFNVFFNKIYL